MERNNKISSNFLLSMLLVFLVSIVSLGCSTETDNNIDNQSKVESSSQDTSNEQATEENEKTDKAVSETAEQTKKADAETNAKKTTKPVETDGTTAKIPVTLVQTIDGDTIKIRYEGKEQNVRYLLIDTPETSHPRLGKQPFGEDAKNRNKQLVNSGELTIEFDVGQRVDRYGRLLAYVYVDGKSVQEALLKEGLARVAYVYPPNTRYLTPYEKAQQQAKNKSVGIWSIENYATDKGFNSDVKKEPNNTQDIAPSSKSKSAPVTQQTPVPENKPAQDRPSQPSGSCVGQIKGSENGIYHTPGSTYYDRTTNVVQWFCSPEEAEKAGYRAPKR